MAVEPHLTPESLVPRLGETLVEKGLLSTLQLQEGLQQQARLRTSGVSMPIGQILIQLGYMDRETLDQAVTEQIIQLRAALQDANRQLEKRVEQRTSELQIALKKLSELNQLKTNIIANVSHELRTPMTHIKGYLDLLLDETFGSLTTEQLKTLNVMQKSSDRLEQLIDDMIRFASAAQGEFSLNMAPVNTQEMLEDIVDKNRPKALVRGLKLELQLLSSLPDVNIDQEAIIWVINHLMDNAIKFTHPPGLVVLSAVVENQMVRISVEDTGIGIPTDRLAEIFEPFQQLDSTSTRRYGGTGLGLALARQIIEAHGSVIAVTSQVGKGSRFDFFIPVEQTAG
jgi:signal transduction histidine kinase